MTRDFGLYTGDSDSRLEDSNTSMLICYGITYLSIDEPNSLLMVIGLNKFAVVASSERTGKSACGFAAHVCSFFRCCVLGCCVCLDKSRPVISQDFSGLWGCGESVNPPKLNIQEVQGALSSRPKSHTCPLPIFQDFLLLSNHTPAKSYHVLGLKKLLLQTSHL